MGIKFPKGNPNPMKWAGFRKPCRDLCELALGQHHHGHEAERGGSHCRRDPSHDVVLGRPRARARCVCIDDRLNAGGRDKRGRVLGVPFRPGPAHIMPLGMVRVTETTHLNPSFHKCP